MAGQDWARRGSFVFYSGGNRGRALVCHTRRLRTAAGLTVVDLRVLLQQRRFEGGPFFVGHVVLTAPRNCFFGGVESQSSFLNDAGTRVVMLSRGAAALDRWRSFG